MNEWKELKKNDLPHDILTEDYDFLYSRTVEGVKTDYIEYSPSISRRLDMIDIYNLRYRKPEPKAPTHEEIMTKWCKVQDHIGERPKWERVARYSDGIYFFSYNDRPLLKRDFIGKALKDIPPEN